MVNDYSRPRVGLGIIIINGKGQILVRRRIGSHAPKFSIPGGALELGETFEAGAIREAKEECDITLIDPKVIAITNNLETYTEEGIHFISVILIANQFEGEPKIMEPTKHTDQRWVDPRNLPEPHFDASRMAVECYLKHVFYLA